MNEATNMSVPDLKLISHKLCPYVQRARIVLDEKKIPHSIEFIDLAQKPAWFLEVSPLGKVPVLLVAGEPLFESAPIAEYLDEITPNSLLPADSFEKARNRAWIEFASATLNAIASFYGARDQSAFADQITVLAGRFATLEKALRHTRYFNGTHFSLVDAAFGPVFRYFDVIEAYDDFGFFRGLVKVQQWRIALRERPSVRNAVVTDYPERLHQFFLERKSALTQRILERSPIAVPGPSDATHSRDGAPTNSKPTRAA